MSFTNAPLIIHYNMCNCIIMHVTNFKPWPITAGTMRAADALSSWPLINQHKKKNGEKKNGYFSMDSNLPLLARLCSHFSVEPRRLLAVHAFGT